MSARVVVISDDFGMTHGVNMGTLKGMTMGIVTNTNIMVPCPWAAEAIQMARRYQLKTGIHLTLTSEWDHYRWGPLTCSKTLTDSLGRFHPDYPTLSKTMTTDDVYREFKTQIQVLRNQGVNLTHIDTHMLPPFTSRPEEIKVAEIVSAIAKEEQLFYIYESRDGKPVYFDSIYEQSQRDFSDFLKYIDNIDSGDHLVITHCAEITEEQEQICERNSSLYAWAVDFRRSDLKIMTNHTVKKLLEQKGIQLISMSEL